MERMKSTKLLSLISMATGDKSILTIFLRKSRLINHHQHVQVGAEFIGTYVLIFCAAGGPIVDKKYDGVETLIGNAACAGLAVMVMILSTGHISGAHYNPAVTVSVAVIGKFPLSGVLPYVTAQLVASILAAFTLKGVYHPFLSGGVTVPSYDVRLPQAIGLEIITSFILLYVITSYAADSGPNFLTKPFAGIAVGGAVMLDILLAGPSTGASMNPARTLGPALATGNYHKMWIYFVGPMIGGIAGATGNRLVV